jgi:hypothetical protein
MRVTPFLKFHLDEQLKKELAVLEALRKGRWNGGSAPKEAPRRSKRKMKSDRRR